MLFCQISLVISGPVIREKVNLDFAYTELTHVAKRLLFATYSNCDDLESI